MHLKLEVWTRLDALTVCVDSRMIGRSFTGCMIPKPGSADLPKPPQILQPESAEARQPLNLNHRILKPLNPKTLL